MKCITTTDPRLTVEDVYDIFKAPVIVKVSRFDTQGQSDFENDISDAHESGQPVIPVVIDSFGGSSYSCLGMISAIENSRLPVATILTSKAMSAGAILFAFGSDGYRFMDPNATLMLHDISDSPDGKLEDLKVDVKHLEHLNEMVYKRMARHLGHKEDYFLQLIKKASHLDVYMTAKEAKKHRIANHLRVPTLDVKISVEYTLK